MSAYYNEHDPFAAAWLRELITDGLIAQGDVDERDIQTLDPTDLAGYTQCHFFAGIGGWSLALRLAGWPDDRPVWTGSCPCQPFSSAGKSGGGGDPRHLWPAWYQLIRECCPPVVFGEQVESAVAHGWLDLVSNDLEREGYAVGAVCLPAASVGAPHRRQRLWFVADADRARQRPSGGGVCDERHDTGRGESVEQLGHAECQRFQGGTDGGGELADTERGATERRRHDLGGATGGLEGPTQERQRLWFVGDTDDAGSQGWTRGQLPERAGQLSPWAADSLVWLPCRDGKARPTEPGLFPLAHGVSNRVGILRGAGNAIVPQVAAAFIAAYQEVNR